MGHANIYIRVDNEIHWDAIEDKSAWVNKQLKEKPIVATKQKAKEIIEKEYIAPKVSKVLVECEHFKTKGNCRYPGCKFY